MHRKGSSYLSNATENESITLIFSPGKDSVGSLAKALKLFKVNRFIISNYIIYEYNNFFCHFVYISLIL